MRLQRRTFLKLSVAGTAAAVAAPATAAAAPGRATHADSVGVLVDTTRCMGCRACEAACAENNVLAEPSQPDEDAVFEARRATDQRTFTVVNRAASPAGADARFVKSQCMHCLEPACATACPARALEKTPSGPVIYHANRCLGCRYCMVACPFDVPKYEYESAAPRVRKCTFCAERQAEGLAPACTSVCPTGALQFGKRADLLLEAKRRVYGQPDKYLPVVYGEEEAGGTSWLYIGDRTPEQLGLKTNVPHVPYSGLAQGALAVVPAVVTLWPPLLMGLYAFSKRRAAVSHDATEEDSHA